MEIQIENEEVKISLLAVYMVVYMTNPKSFIGNSTPTCNKQFQQRYCVKTDLTKISSTHTYKWQKDWDEIMEITAFKVASGNIKYLGIALTKKVKNL